ncbi:508_t:CDS:2 [Gigaspora margarita]|uniref:508_t:CDS:1 n=1 Tax=Gigaspora margarita TaxID=4874 RepID=A0ABN7W383_GIGMA|nr:508_t:CDS:2 [Gigaspora margarita]
MNRNRTLAFILLVALSVINATTWDSCSYNNIDIPLLTATLSPDPPALGQLAAGVTGNVANSIIAFDFVTVEFFTIFANGSYQTYNFFADFFCGGENQLSCQDNPGDILLFLILTLDQTFDAIRFAIYYLTWDKTVFPYLGCIFGDFRPNAQGIHDISNIKNLSSLPPSFLMRQKTFSNTNNIVGDKYKFDSVNKYTSGYQFNSLNFTSGGFVDIELRHYK